MIPSPFDTAASVTVIAGTLSFAPISRADDVTVIAPEPAPVVVVRPAPATETVQTRTESAGADTTQIWAESSPSASRLRWLPSLPAPATVGLTATSTSRFVGPWLDST